MEIGSGHHWVAMRIPDDSYAVVANQLAIQEIDFNDAKTSCSQKKFKNSLKKTSYGQQIKVLTLEKSLVRMTIATSTTTHHVFGLGKNY